MRTFPKYPHIDQLYKVNNILDEEVIVTEKIHGTNLRFMYDSEAGFVVGSRENVIYHHNQKFGELYGVVDYLITQGIDHAVKHSKYEGYVFFGEFYGESIQKGVKYCKGKQFRIFDICNPDGVMLDWDDVVKVCEELTFPTVPVLSRGYLNIHLLDCLKVGNSIVGKENGFDEEGNEREGVVIKPTKMKLDKHGNWLYAKYKSKKWEENAKMPKTAKDLDPAKMDLLKEAKEFAEVVVTEGRVSVVVEHITRDENQELDMKRTPEFLRELIKDVQEEHQDTYSILNKEQQNAYNKAVSSRGLPFWKKLVEDK